MKLKAPKVLVIDDDAAFGHALGRWLSDLGYQPSVAASAAQGVALLEEGGFEVVLLDLRLPDVSGLAVLRQLNSAGGDIPVIVVSGTTEVDDVVRVWRENAADFLHKPFSIDSLSAALDRALKRSRPVAGATPLPVGHADPAVASVQPSAPMVAAEPAPRSSRERLRPAVAKLRDGLKSGAVRLPILDPRVLRLPEFLTTENWNVDELADTVIRDSNLAAAILRSANSAAYARGQEITSLRDACARLGSKAVVAIAFEITTKGQFNAPDEPGRTALKDSWRNAVVASRVAPLIGQMLRFPDPEDLRVATLFHNVGELLAICLIGDLDRPSGVVSTAAQLGIEVSAIHEDLGLALATSWKLPPTVIRLAGHHHRPASTPEPNDEKLLRHVALASWSIGLRAGFTYFPEHKDVDARAFTRVLGLADHQIEHIVEKIKTWQV